MLKHVELIVGRGIGLSHARVQILVLDTCQFGIQTACCSLSLLSLALPPEVKLGLKRTFGTVEQ